MQLRLKGSIGNTSSIFVSIVKNMDGYRMQSIERREGSVILLLVKKLQLIRRALSDTVTPEFRMMITSS
jgi:hypothetical protein